VIKSEFSASLLRSSVTWSFKIKIQIWLLSMLKTLLLPFYFTILC